MAIKRITSLLSDLTEKKAHFRPTILYNEGWLLRIIIDWFSENQVKQHKLNFLPGATWYSEPMLPTTFHARYRGDKLSEARTHADAVIGHFDIGIKGKADFVLQTTAHQFLVLEAKISSPLSRRTRHAPYFDQAARNVACMAEAISRSNCQLTQFNKIGFYVLAPQKQIEKGKFQNLLNQASITEKVEQRVEEYKGEKAEWYQSCFIPLIKRIDIEAISWESIIGFIKSSDSNAGAEIDSFYKNCIQFN